jgi:hypothetical protein
MPAIMTFLSTGLPPDSQLLAILRQARSAFFMVQRHALAPDGGIGLQREASFSRNGWRDNSGPVSR